MFKAITTTLISCALALFSASAVAQEFKGDPDWNLQRHCTNLKVLRDSHQKVIWFNHEQMKSMATTKVAPGMPLLARQARIEGSVTVNVCIGSDGVPDSAWVISGHPILIPSSIEAASKWRFKPYVHKSKPVAFAGTIRFTFSTSKGNGY